MLQRTVAWHHPKSCWFQPLAFCSPESMGQGQEEALDVCLPCPKNSTKAPHLKLEDGDGES